MAPEAAVSIFDTHVLFAETSGSQRAKIHVPNTIVDLFESHVLSGTAEAQMDPGTVPAETAVVTEIASFRNALGIPAGAVELDVDLDKDELMVDKEWPASPVRELHADAHF